LFPWRAVKKQEGTPHTSYCRASASPTFRLPFLPIMPSLFQHRTKREKDPGYAASTTAAQWFADNHEKYGPLFYFSLGSHPRVVIADPALVRQAYVVSANDVFPKNALFREIKILGDGLLTANGLDWTRQRRLINPAFSHKEVKVRPVAAPPSVAPRSTGE